MSFKLATSETSVGLTFFFIEGVIVVVLEGDSASRGVTESVSLGFKAGVGSCRRFRTSTILAYSCSVCRMQGLLGSLPWSDIVCLRDVVDLCIDLATTSLESRSPCLLNYRSVSWRSVPM